MHVDIENVYGLCHCDYCYGKFKRVELIKEEFEGKIWDTLNDMQISMKVDFIVPKFMNNF